MTDKIDETCAHKTMGPWLAGTAILFCAAIALAFYHADDLRQGQRNEAAAPAANGGDRPAATFASFVPPWHGRQDPSAVTGATPKRASLNRRRCWLGINVHPVDSVLATALELPLRRGVLVNRVFVTSPAGQAGLLRGDVIYRVNDRRVRDAEMFWSFLADAKAGDEVKLTLLRKNSKKTLVLTLEPEPANIRSLFSKAP